ncbi:MAG: type secretion system lipoprotein TssJ [Pseudomonadota bacterium]
MMFVTRFLSVVFLLLLCACAADAPIPPTPLPPTVIQLDIDSQPLINPDASGKASPVLLRIYELRETNNFLGSDFFALFDKEQATLAADLVRKQEVWLKPGEHQTLQLQAASDTRSIGFFAVFRKLDDAQWRAWSSLTPHQLNLLRLTINGNRLTMEQVGKKTVSGNPVE